MAPEDSRRYTYPRLPSFSGYSDPPVVDSSLTFNLPPFNQHSGRIVDQSPTDPLIPAHEAWSPNSMVRPFYPGLPPPNFETRTLPDRALRRFDGHLGPFDHTMNPQVLTASVWKALILRPSVGHLKSDEYPEHRFIHKEWEATAGRTSYGPSEGHIKFSYVVELESRLALLDSLIAACSDLELTYTNFWSQRPSFPHRTAIDDLRRIKAYEDVVDLGVAVQRGLKEKAAYLLFANLVLSSGYQQSVDNLVASEIPVADDRYLGAWINGDRRQDALWLLSQKIPCFVVHALSITESWLADDPGVHSSWWQTTEAALLRLETNGYDSIAKRLNSSARPYVAAVIRAAVPSASEEDRERTSASNQGWTGKEIGFHSSRPPPPPREPSPMIVDTPVVAPTIKPSLAAPSLDLVVVDKDRAPWIHPPVCFDSKGLSGVWTKWEYDDNGSLKEMSKRAAKEFEGFEGSDEGKCFYDRANRRELYIDRSRSSPVPEGLISNLKFFGRPAPRVVYLDPYGRQVKGSHWMYPFRFDEDGMVGKACPPPEPTSLPLKKGLPAPAPAINHPQPAAPPIVATVAISRSSPTTSKVTATSSSAGATKRPRISAPPDDGQVSLGSSSEGEEEDIEDPTCYLRTSPFPVSADWHDVRHALISLTYAIPEALILRVDRTSTPSLQTLWVSLNSSEGAAALRIARASLKVSTVLGGDLHWATWSEMQQVQSLGGESWTRTLPPSQLVAQRTEAISPVRESRRRAASPLDDSSRSRWRGRTPPSFERHRSPSPPPPRRPTPPRAPLDLRPRRAVTSRHWSPPRPDHGFERGRSERRRPMMRGPLERPTTSWRAASSSASSSAPEPSPTPPVATTPVTPASQLVPTVGTREHALFMAQVLIEAMTRAGTTDPAFTGAALGSALANLGPQAAVSATSVPAAMSATSASAALSANSTPAAVSASSEESMVPSIGTAHSQAVASQPSLSATAFVQSPASASRTDAPSAPLMQRLNVGILERLSDAPSVPPAHAMPHLMHRLRVGLGERISDVPTAGPSSAALAPAQDHGREEGEIGEDLPERRKRGRRAGRGEYEKEQRRLAARARDMDDPLLLW
ncbi:hypothetical protein FPV67DRAFT_1675737 [Lyophyllum atratum]|nr:hypothetical protein FPV67DRAFT_1675737 [Lyophyllum atratum]